jgi:dipeptidyl aminopeptidase/acylaminoacyl peptidase
MIELFAAALLVVASLAPAAAGPPLPASGPAVVVAPARPSPSPAPSPGAPAGSAPAASVPANAAAAAPGRGQRLLTAGDLLQLGKVADPRLSPEGSWVAYTVETLDRKQDKATADVYMVPLAGGTAIRLTAPAEKPAASPRFSPDGRWLAFLSAREGRHAQVWLLYRRGGEAQRLTDYPADVAELAWSPDGRRLALVVADADRDRDEPETTAAADAGAGGAEARSRPASPPAPKPIVIHRMQFKRDGEGYLRELRNHLYVFDLQTRASVQVTTGPYDDSEPAWSPDGRWLAFTSNRTPEPDANENTDVFVVPAAAGFTPRAVTTSPGTDQSPAFSPDGKLIVYVEGSDPKDFWYGTSRIAVAPALPGAAGAPRALTAALDRNVTSPRFASDGRAVYFLVEEGGNSHLARVPLAGGAVERVVDGERVVEAFDLDARGDVVVLESVPQRPPEVSVVTRQGLRRLTTTNDELLRALRLAPVRRFTAKSADGTPIDAFLTLPPDAPAGALLPAVLRIHGGPVSQFDTSFRFEWQLLAAHGYAVVGANPRGSSGYGRDFARAIWADWGNRDFQDVMAAVDQVVAMGIADPQRLGVGGWSYGGILTNYVIIKTGRFKAAISGASETNYLADYGTDHYQYAWETELGLPWRNTELWLKLSPWFQVEKITTPTLLLCGTDDANVPPLGVEQLYEALRRLGRDTELVLYPGQTHTLTRPSFLVDRYQRYLDWYDKYLKPAAAAAAGGPAATPPARPR